MEYKNDYGDQLGWTDQDWTDYLEEELYNKRPAPVTTGATKKSQEDPTHILFPEKPTHAVTIFPDVPTDDPAILQYLPRPPRGSLSQKNDILDILRRKREELLIEISKHLVNNCLKNRTHDVIPTYNKLYKKYVDLTKQQNDVVNDINKYNTGGNKIKKNRTNNKRNKNNRRTKSKRTK